MNKDNKTRSRGLIKYIPVKDKLFWLLLIVFIGIPLLYFSYIPIWDGWQFSRCYMKAVTNETLDCYRHSAFLHTFLFSLTQRIDLGNFQLIYATNLLFGIAGLICLRSLLAYLFSARLSPANLTLLTFCFGLNPVFLVHVIQPCLDFTLPILLIMILLFLFTNRFILAAAAGILLVFTKESGFMLYSLSVFLFLLLMIFNDRSLLHDLVKLLRKTIILIIPVLLFGIYMRLVPDTQIGSTWTEGVMKMFRFYLVSDVMQAQLMSLFVINFNWIISAVILINAAVLAVQYLRFSTHKAVIKSVFNKSYEGIYFCVLFVAIVYFLTRIPFVNNPRYMLPALPVMIILFGGSLINVLRKQTLITVALTIVLTLLTVSSLRTIDPVSKKAMGTFKFGSHEMLQMARFEELKHGYGRDHLAYNFEFTQFHYITEKIFRKVGWARNFVIPRELTWLPDFGAFDTVSGRRSIRGDRVRSLIFIYSDEITADNAPQEIYYISYPNYDRDNMNANNRAKLSRMYDFKEVIKVENGGYAIDVFRYVLKKNG
jgi:hypothetical protein